MTYLWGLTMMPMASMLGLMASITSSHPLAVEVSKYQMLKQRLLEGYPNWRSLRCRNA